MFSVTRLGHFALRAHIPHDIARNAVVASQSHSGRQQLTATSNDADIQLSTRQELSVLKPSM